MQKKLKISVIVKTYNWPEALSLVLKSLNQQKTKYQFEVIIADDGSTKSTTELINTLRPKLSYQIKHIWHQDLGFRASTISNKAIQQATGNYCIFIDGDCICPKSFIAKHAQLAETNYFVAGGRVLVTEQYTKQALSDKNIEPAHFSFFNLCKLKLHKQCNKVHPLIYLPLANFRKLSSKKWKNAKCCNLATWKQDLLNVKGFDEQFEGWGHEDSELVARLINSGVKRKNGKFATTVIHLGHKLLDRNKQAQNFASLMQTLNNQKTQTKTGLESNKKYTEPEHTNKTKAKETIL